MSKYQVTFNLIFREQAHYNEGCAPDSGTTEWLADPIFIEANTVLELLKAVQAHFKVTPESISLDSCDEIGRVDVQTYTKSPKGVKCTYKRYKGGFQLEQYSLWLNTIIGEVVKTPEVVNLSNYEIMYRNPLRI